MQLVRRLKATVMLYQIFLLSLVLSNISADDILDVERDEDGIPIIHGKRTIVDYNRSTFYNLHTMRSS